MSSRESASVGGLENVEIEIEINAVSISVGGDFAAESELEGLRIDPLGSRGGDEELEVSLGRESSSSVEILAMLSFCIRQIGLKWLVKGSFLRSSGEKGRGAAIFSPRARGRR